MIYTIFLLARDMHLNHPYIIKCARMQAYKIIYISVKDKSANPYSIHIIVRCMCVADPVDKSACMALVILMEHAIIIYSNRAVIMKLYSNRAIKTLLSLMVMQDNLEHDLQYTAGMIVGCNTCMHACIVYLRECMLYIYGVVCISHHNFCMLDV